jgi:hypothetical protein
MKKPFSGRPYQVPEHEDELIIVEISLLVKLDKLRSFLFQSFSVDSQAHAKIARCHRPAYYTLTCNGRFGVSFHASVKLHQTKGKVISQTLKFSKLLESVLPTSNFSSAFPKASVPKHRIKPNCYTITCNGDSTRGCLKDYSGYLVETLSFTCCRM